MLSFLVGDIKKFMNLLLRENTFDYFTFKKADIKSYISYNLDGYKNEINPEELNIEEYCLWEDIKPFIFQAVKGKKLPLKMNIVLSLPKNLMGDFSFAKSVFLNLMFKEEKLICTTSFIEESFSLTKSDNDSWNQYVLDFFKKNEIEIYFAEES